VWPGVMLWRRAGVVLPHGSALRARLSGGGGGKVEELGWFGQFQCGENGFCSVVSAERWATRPWSVTRVTRCTRSSSWWRLRQVCPVVLSMTRSSSGASKHSRTWVRMRSSR